MRTHSPSNAIAKACGAHNGTSPGKRKFFQAPLKCCLFEIVGARARFPNFYSFVIKACRRQLFALSHRMTAAMTFAESGNGNYAVAGGSKTERRKKLAHISVATDKMRTLSSTTKTICLSAVCVCVCFSMSAQRHRIIG